MRAHAGWRLLADVAGVLHLLMNEIVSQHNDRPICVYTSRQQHVQGQAEVWWM